MGKALGLWVIVSLAVVGGCGVLIGGCGDTDRIDTTRAVLDATAITANTLYQAAVVTCDTTAKVLIARADDRDEALEIEAEIDAKCAAVYDLFGAVHVAHEAALVIVGQVEQGLRPVEALLSSLAHLAQVAIRAQEAWQSLREVLERRAADPPADDVSRHLEDVERWARAERARWAS